MSHMIERLRARKEQEGGFTLVELLVVIVILGILAAIVVFAVSGVGDKGQLSSCKADRAAVESAEEAYFAAQATPAYGSMTDLVNGGFLRRASTLHSVTPNNTASPKTYAVTQLGACSSLTY